MPIIFESDSEERRAARRVSKGGIPYAIALILL